MGKTAKKNNTAKMPKHGKAFALAYINNSRNATAAARTLPGISDQSASETGSKLLSNLEVQAEIARLERKLEEKTLITKQRLIDEWARIAFADPGDVMSWNESGIEMIPKEKLAADKRRLIKSLSHHTTATGESFKVELVDRDSAKKELAKLLGYYPEEGTGDAVKLVFMFGGKSNG
jgi:phage terminase small subunit